MFGLVTTLHHQIMIIMDENKNMISYVWTDIPRYQ